MILNGKTGNSFKAGASSMSGTLKALFDIRDGNNGENFTGEARVIDSKHVKVVSPSITDIEAMTVPESGTLPFTEKITIIQNLLLRQMPMARSHPTHLNLRMH